MARIRTSRRPGTTRVAVAGRLAAPDLGRLEHACGEALARQPLHLHLDLTRVTEIDGAAAALLDRLSRRGADVHGRPARVFPFPAAGEPEPAERDER